MTRIRERLGIEADSRPGSKGQFDVLADGETVTRRGGNALTRMFGAGYPDLDNVVDQLEAMQKN